VSKLRDNLALKSLSKTDKFLLIVANHDGPIENSEIKAIARENGWRDGADSAPASFLSKSTQAILLPKGWTITEAGRKKFEALGHISPIGVLTPVTAALEGYLLTVRDPNKARFVEEAVSCVKGKNYRAAIVLTWVGAVYLLYNHIINHKIVVYNTEIRRRWPKMKDANCIDDLSALKENEFLSVIEHLKIITPAERKELSSCLDRRNTAGHPNSHLFEEVTVGSHIQTLITSVYSKF
jgi:hypothetical protein